MSPRLVAKVFGAVVVLGSCGGANECGPRSLTPVAPPAASASARCEALVRTVLAGDQVTLVAAYESTAQEISLWMESGNVPGGGRAGPGQAPTRSLPPSESIASCYFDGTFTYRGPLPPGATPPRFERMLFLIDGSGVPILTMGGPRHLFPLVRPQP